MWITQWTLRRPEPKLSHKLLVEQANENPCSFLHFMRLPPVMFDKLVLRLGIRTTKAGPNYHLSLAPILKAAITPSRPLIRK